VEILGVLLKFCEVTQLERKRTGVRVKWPLAVLVPGRGVRAFQSRHCPESAADGGLDSPADRIPVGGADCPAWTGAMRRPHASGRLGGDSHFFRFMRRRPSQPPRVPAVQRPTPSSADRPRQMRYRGVARHLPTVIGRSPAVIASGAKQSPEGGHRRKVCLAAPAIKARPDGCTDCFFRVGEGGWIDPSAAGRSRKIVPTPGQSVPPPTARPPRYRGAPC
jgi:hypothetical protein